jgi:hypothetical protein
MDILWIYPPTNIWRWKIDETCTFADDLRIGYDDVHSCLSLPGGIPKFCPELAQVGRRRDTKRMKFAGN